MNYTKIRLPYSIKTEILAVGAQSKSAFCFVKDNSAYLSYSGGDLSDLSNFKEFEKDIKKLQKKLKMAPVIIACDLHPEYTATKYAYNLAKSIDRRVKKIQHHEAHVASCMIDNNIKSEVIGIAFDGTGFGRDGNIWGGEFFVGGIKGLKRAAYLKYIPMPGGEACVKEPWRMAFSYMYAIYGKKLRLFYPDFAGTRNDMLGQMVDKKINSPLTSSMGRLFDGVSALIGICSFAEYEGEAAIGLEKIIAGAGLIIKKKYSFKYKNENEIIIIDWGPIIKGIVEDFKKGVDKSEISIKFHNAICDMIKDVCNLLKKRYKIKKVCLSGGVFQNKYLRQNIKPVLEKEGFDIYLHKNIPTHDGGIALGQAVLAGV